MPLPKEAPQKFNLIGQAVPEKKIVEIVDDDDDGRTDGGRTPDHGHPISSPYEPSTQLS